MGTILLHPSARQGSAYLCIVVTTATASVSTCQESSALSDTCEAAGPKILSNAGIGWPNSSDDMWRLLTTTCDYLPRNKPAWCSATTICSPVHIHCRFELLWHVIVVRAGMYSVLFNHVQPIFSCQPWFWITTVLKHHTVNQWAWAVANSAHKAWSSYQAAYADQVHQTLCYSCFFDHWNTTSKNHPTIQRYFFHLPTSPSQSFSSMLLFPHMSPPAKKKKEIRLVITFAAHLTWRMRPMSSLGGSNFLSVSG